MALSKNINDREKNKFISKRGTRVRTLSIPEDGNNIDVVITSIGTTATFIDFPENSNLVTLAHFEAGEVIYIGDENVTTSTGFPLNEKWLVEVSCKAGNNNNFYAIVASGTTDLYATGVYTE